MPPTQGKRARAPARWFRPHTWRTSPARLETNNEAAPKLVRGRLRQEEPSSSSACKCGRRGHGVTTHPLYEGSEPGRCARNTFRRNWATRRKGLNPAPCAGAHRGSRRVYRAACCRQWRARPIYIEVHLFDWICSKARLVRPSSTNTRQLFPPERFRPHLRTAGSCRLGLPAASICA